MRGQTPPHPAHRILASAGRVRSAKPFAATKPCEDLTIAIPIGYDFLARVWPRSYRGAEKNPRQQKLPAIFSLAPARDGIRVNCLDSLHVFSLVAKGDKGKKGCISGICRIRVGRRKATCPGKATYNERR